MELGKINIDYKKLDEVIRKYVPSGQSSHETKVADFDLTRLKCYKHIRGSKHIEGSVGTLGSGNHFIELDTDSDGNKYLIIHSGSRNLGKQVAEYYQDLAFRNLHGKKGKSNEDKQALIKQYKKEGKESELAQALEKFEEDRKFIATHLPDKDLAHLTSDDKDAYLHDMKLCQEYAVLNRKTMGNIIVKYMNFKVLNKFETIHNYIDLDTKIIRKGAVSAKKGEKLLIPINMKDGCLICIGKGNEDWNCSAPHGAGRLYSRTQAKKKFTVEEFKNSMQGIYTTSVNEGTLDESPMAYKPIEDILEFIGETAEIEKVIYPAYNFKATEQEHGYRREKRNNRTKENEERAIKNETEEFSRLQ